MANRYRIFLVEGDHQESIRFTWTGKDLSSGTIQVYVRTAAGKTLSLTTTAVDLPNGVFDINLPSGGLEAGSHEMEVQHTDAGSAPITLPADEPFTLIVRNEIQPPL